MEQENKAIRPAVNVNNTRRFVRFAVLIGAVYLITVGNNENSATPKLHRY